ncbi:MAG: hypothetical protein MZW92_39365 [Comamonadaceae bacterium]|nr:hypothetical protein [Comamonadaceae bacterium]
MQTWLEQQPEIDRSFSLVDVVEEMNRAYNSGEVGANALPADRKPDRAVAADLRRPGPVRTGQPRVPARPRHPEPQRARRQRNQAW